MTPWSAADIPEQSGRVAVVTGANSGLGLVASRELARAGAHVVLACRDASRGGQAVERIRSEIGPDAQLALGSLDLSSLESVREFAETMISSHAKIDLLINNAGVMAPPRGETAEGFELQFGTNHLGHFALTGRLLPALTAAGAPRVVTVTSTMHWFGRINFDDLQHERRYNRWSAYGQAKLANLLFARELDRRAAEARSPLRSMAAHPGYSATHLQTSGPGGGGLIGTINKQVLGLTNRLVAQSDEMGALPELYAATYPGLESGSFIGPSRFDQMAGPPKAVRSMPWGSDMEVAGRLWEESERLTGVSFALGAPATA